MYRQVLVHQSQRNLQKIFWRSNPGERLQSYTLNTVTYGHASASFLAIRCLFELANECEENQSDIAPLCPLTPDPNDLSPLTPAHFLIGRSLVAAPDEDLSDVKINRLSRFQLIQRLIQHYWKRWQRDYIAELQQRQKWRINKGQLVEG
ncbi:hypothetical protein NQ318_015402, partial [Aromia moschata]